MALLVWGLVVLPLVLVAFGFSPQALVNGKAWFPRVVVAVVFGQFLLAAAFCAVRLAEWAVGMQSTLPELGVVWLPGCTVLYDNVASCMLALVSFVGWVICVYSIRYLDGEPQQGRYFRAVAFTIGAVSLMVISGNLLLLSVAWVMSSVGLHRLLLHYGHRPAARRAAWTKFAFSRIGDVTLWVSMILLYVEFQTLDLAQLFHAASETEPTLRLHLANLLLIVTAITKSAQFPFHTWLPLTMETPTPVSALMHAGVVNAGGYLMIRTSPLVAQTPSALTILALIGGFTACFAAVMMITQFSIKNKLAYSTIAQMGFMLLQCGLGAFSAAMLHIIAHSLYKAYAFLSSGSVMQHRAATLGAQSCSGNYFWLRLAMFATVPVLALASGYAWLGVNLAQKPGGMLLGSLLVLAFAHWITQVSFNQSTRKLLTALGASMLLCLVYVGCYALVDSLITASLPVIAKPALPTFVQACLLTGFVAVFGLSVHVVSAKPSAWSNRLYVHWSNGFYVESFLRRITVPGYRMFSGK